ncbi:MAG: SH3 domain-containing protein, partial [Alphaproteobacteria bacterium]|nr:SH3 domain-containing protein [Alphaproteobacteria bacterium]
LASLIAPYRSQGRITLRLERLPQRARLSVGRNNGDNSWSLATDELEGLLYLPPEGAAGVHILSVRVLDIDSASTLAVIDLPVTLGEATGTSAEAELNRIGDEIERVRTVLSGHEASLAATLSRQAAPAEDVTREFQQARQSWDLEREKLIAERDSAIEAALARAKDAWQAEIDVRLHQREELARHELATARERWQSESAAALARAERAFKADESAKLAELERKLRSEAQARLAAELGARETDEKAQKDEELARLRADFSKTLSVLAERESALAQERLKASREREGLRRETAHALEEARSALAAEAARELEQARAAWEAESTEALVLANAGRARAEAALAAVREEAAGARGEAENEVIAARERAQSELSALKEELAVSQSTAASAQALIGKLKLQFEDEARKAQSATADTLARARETWVAEEAAHLAAEKAVWQKQQERLLQSLRSEHDASRSHEVVLLEEMRERLELVETHLAERELELRETREDAQAELETLREQSAAQLQRAERAWKTAEAARASAARSQWREQSMGALADATRRYQAAEAALAAQRARAEAGMRRGEPADLERLRQEVVLLQSALGSCEAELGELRTAIAGSDPRQDDGFVLEPLQVDRFIGHDDATPPPRSIWREAVAMAAVVALAIFCFPMVEPLLPDPWQQQINALNPFPPPQVHRSRAVIRAATPTPVAQKIVVVAAGTKLRAAPSSSADIVQTLPSDAKLVDVSTEGNWTHVRAVTANDKLLEGWVHTSRLRPPAPASSSLRS